MALYRMIILLVAVVALGGCASILKYAPPTVISGSKTEVKIRAGINAGHPGGAATDYCRKLGKSAIMTDDPPIDGFWTNTKIYRFECG